MQSYRWANEMKQPQIYRFERGHYKTLWSVLDICLYDNNLTPVDGVIRAVRDVT